MTEATRPALTVRPAADCDFDVVGKRFADVMILPLNTRFGRSSADAVATNENRTSKDSAIDLIAEILHEL